MPKRISMTARALSAIGLMVGFYVLALGIAAVLLYIVYADLTYGRTVHGRIVIFCAVGALLIIWSVLPRWDRFTPPGPALTVASQPRLLEEIRQIAQATRQTMPVEIYLAPDVNAWVGQRGGVMGFGSRRIMGLGLPLLSVLARDEFRAVLAHEFGHYSGGDTKLGPWVYKTRGAILRTVENLSNNSSILSFPFMEYAKMFLRVSHGVSRQQEFAADALAAEVAGGTSLISGLEKLHAAAVVFPHYIQEDVLPTVSSGYHPPIGDGLREFLASNALQEKVEELITQELETGQTNPLDTHPSLRERIDATGVSQDTQIRWSEDTALRLLDNIESLERSFLNTENDPDHVGTLKPITWTEVPERVLIPIWQSLTTANAEGLQGITPANIPSVLQDGTAVASRFVDITGERTPQTRTLQHAVAVLAAALSVRLLADGWEMHRPLGEPTSFRSHTGIVIEPFPEVRSLAQDPGRNAQWMEKSAKFGISTLLSEQITTHQDL